MKTNSIGRARPRHLPLLTLVCASIVLTGCVTSTKYKMAKKDAPPAEPLSWSVAAPPAELKLETLIVIKGPGSWKREARWDEYVVQVANHGDRPVTINSATLVDVLGKPQVPGDDPWKLEKLSYTNWDKYGKTGLTLVAGAGVVFAYGAAVIAAEGGILGGGSMFGGGAAAATGAGAGALAAIPIIAVVDITVVAVMNHNNKKAVQAEFDRRRLKLPLTIAPGATARGSFFFPMTPGPQRLTLSGQSGDAPLELVLGLKPLAGLHLKAAGKK